MLKPIKQLCAWKNPEIVIQALIKIWGQEGLVWLDGDGSKLGTNAIIGIDPIKQICCRGLPNEPNSSNPFKALRDLGPGHWCGWLSYEAGAWLEPNNPWKPHPMSTLWIAQYDPILRFNLRKKELLIEGFASKRIQEIMKLINSISYDKENEYNEYLIKIKETIKIPLKAWQWKTKKKEYITMVNYLKELIASGDIFQANLTACCSTSLPKKISAIDLFQRLRQSCSAPFSGLIIAKGMAKGEAILSSSPERFLKVLPNGEIETRPIKGTRPRNIDIVKDSDMAARLITSEKDRAENIMIVDILRNDLGKICIPGSITIPQLVGLESYRHVHHLTSVIKGSLNPNKSWIDVLEACWPGGSISGAPKLRACKRLYELEPIARGPYCGSLLHIDWNGQLDSNILIRSLMMQGSILDAHAGCGIVADSSAELEAEELNWKLIPLIQALA